MNDREIVNLYWERRETAITATADKYGGYCHTIAHNILHNNEDAEECVNDTWVGAWNSMPPKRPERLSTYLGKITRHVSLDRFRAYTADRRGGGQTVLALAELEECIPAVDSVEQAVDDHLLVDAVNSFLRAQPARKRHIFVRRYWYLYSVKDIAAAYAISESAVVSTLFRMRNDLKNHLEKEGIVL